MYILAIVILIIVALIIWFLLSNQKTKKTKKTEETHIHPKAHFDQRKNTITFRTSPHAKMYKIFKLVLVTDENRNDLWNITTNEDSGMDFGLKPLVEHLHDGTSGPTTVDLPPDEVIEPNQLQIHVETNTATTEIHTPATATTNPIRTYTATITQNDTNFRGASFIIQETGSIYFQTQKGSKITVTAEDGTPLPSDILDNLALQAYFGVLAGVENPSITLYGAYRPIALYGDQPPGCTFEPIRDSARYCGVDQSSGAPCTNICDQAGANNQTNVEFGHGNFFYFGFGGQTATFKFTIDETDLIDCGDNCPN